MLLTLETVCVLLTLETVCVVNIGDIGDCVCC